MSAAASASCWHHVHHVPVMCILAATRLSHRSRCPHMRSFLQQTKQTALRGMHLSWPPQGAHSARGFKMAACYVASGFLVEVCHGHLIMASCRARKSVINTTARAGLAELSCSLILTQGSTSCASAIDSSGYQVLQPFGPFRH